MILIFIFGLLPLIVSYSNCSRSRQFYEPNSNFTKLSSEKNPSSFGMGGSGNGEPYGGKPLYFAFEVGHTCRDAFGNEIASPMGAIEETPLGYSLRFAGCLSKDLGIPASELTTIEFSDRPGLLYGGRVYQKYNSLPDIRQMKIPEKFCYESKLASLIGTSQSGSFYEVNTFGTYVNGRSTRFIQRSILQGAVNLEATPIENFEVSPVEKIEDTQFFKYLADIFSISLDLSLTTRKTINGMTFDEFYGEGDLFLPTTGGSMGLTLICSNMPTLPLLVPPPAKNSPGVGAIPPPPPTPPTPPPPPPAPPQ